MVALACVSARSGVITSVKRCPRLIVCIPSLHSRGHVSKRWCQDPTQTPTSLDNNQGSAVNLDSWAHFLSIKSLRDKNYLTWHNSSFRCIWSVFSPHVLLEITEGEQFMTYTATRGQYRYFGLTSVELSCCPFLYSQCLFGLFQCCILWRQLHIRH